MSNDKEANEVQVTQEWETRQQTQMKRRYGNRKLSANEEEKRRKEKRNKGEKEEEKRKDKSWSRREESSWQKEIRKEKMGIQIVVTWPKPE